MTRLKWKLISVRLEIVLIPVCAKHTIGSVIVLEGPDGTPR
jgi:hypothetical protein